MTKPTDVTPEISTALAELRRYASTYPGMGLSAALNVLDNAGVFAGIDEANDYASAEEILAESALRDVERQNGLDPEEWGDLTRADLASRQRPVHDPYVCEARSSDGPSLHAGTCPAWQQHHNL